MPEVNPQTAPARSYRVLMVAPTSFFADYGCHVRILEEVRVLQQLGHKVTLVTYHNGRDLPGIDIRRTLPIPWRQHYEVGSSRHKVGFDVLLGLKTLELVARNRYDVIHAHLHEGALIGEVLGKLFHVPVLFDFQGSLTEEMIDHRFLRRESWVYPPLRRLERHIDRSAPIIFTSSANARSVLTDQFDCTPDQIRELPDCVNVREFRPASGFAPAELGALRQRLGIPDHARLIVYLGLLAEYQGTTHLLQSMQTIRAVHDDAYLLLMGFPGVDFYQDQAVALGVRDRVIFTGRVPYEAAPLHLALGEVAVAPKLSLTESAGKLLNYMAASLPTVAYDTPVAREYLGVNGCFAERGSVPDLAAKVLDLLADRERAQQIGQALRRRAAESFSWDAAAQQIVDAYDQLTGVSFSTAAVSAVASANQSH